MLLEVSSNHAPLTSNLPEEMASKRPFTVQATLITHNDYMNTTNSEWGKHINLSDEN